MRVISLFVAVAVTLLCSSFVALCAEPPWRQDTWGHYVHGGTYVCNSGSMSPNGEYLVFGSPRKGNGDIWRLHLKDSTLDQLTDSVDFNSEPAFSPDGESIFYLREREGYTHIWRMDKNGKSHEQLTFGEVVDKLMDIAPNGNNLLISRFYYLKGAGRGLDAGTTMVYSISDKKMVDEISREDIGSARFFLDSDTLLFSSFGKDNAFGKYDMVSKKRNIWGKGWIECVSSNKKIVCIWQQAAGRDFIKRDLALFDVDKQNAKELGIGMYPCFLGDSKIFFVQSSPRKACIYSLNGTTHEMELPWGVVTPPVVAAGNRGVLLRLRSPTDADRAGNIYLFNGAGIEKLTQ